MTVDAPPPPPHTRTHTHSSFSPLPSQINSSLREIQRPGYLGVWGGQIAVVIEAEGDLFFFLLSHSLTKINRQTLSHILSQFNKHTPT
jgi:hypothetical protein